MNLFINPNVLAKVQAQQNPLLNVPTDAVAGRNRTYRWAELLVITGVSKGDTDKNRVELVVRYKVSLASPNPSNRGKGTRSRFLINTEATPGSGDETMTMISLGNVHNLVRAAAPELDLTSGMDLGLLFDEQNSPLLNVEIIGQIQDKPDRDDPEIRRQEISRFSPAS